MNKQELVSDYYTKAGEAASECVEEMARKILRENKDLFEFVMGMGTFFFVDKDNNIIDFCSDYEQEFKPLTDFIDEWDRVLKITGEPMRFTEKGVKITEF